MFSANQGRTQGEQGTISNKGAAPRGQGYFSRIRRLAHKDPHFYAYEYAYFWVRKPKREPKKPKSRGEVTAPSFLPSYLLLLSNKYKPCRESCQQQVRPATMHTID